MKLVREGGAKLQCGIDEATTKSDEIGFDFPVRRRQKCPRFVGHGLPGLRGSIGSGSGIHVCPSADVKKAREKSTSGPNPPELSPAG